VSRVSPVLAIAVGLAITGGIVAGIWIYRVVSGT
jgi:hypothetical protein